MSTFVLLHGAFRGGWAWQRVRPLLVAAGYDVHAPTLSGSAAGLDDWVDQVAWLIESEDLDDVVLVGHSQGGVIVREVALRLPERLDHVVYVDAAVPDPGERAVDLGPAPPVLPPRETQIPPRPLVPGGDLDETTAQWLNARLTATPFAPSLDPVSTAVPGVPATYAFCSGTPDGYPSQTTRARLDERGVSYETLDAGHDAPLTAPALVADLLLRVATDAQHKEQ